MTANKNEPQNAGPQTVYVLYDFPPEQRFETACFAILEKVRMSQRRFPNMNRGMALEIQGHRNSEGGFDNDAYELQVGFILGFLMHYLTHVIMPLGNVTNPHQRNDIPEKFKILPPKE